MSDTVPFPRAGWLGSWLAIHIKPRIVRAFVRRVTKPAAKRQPPAQVPF